MNLARFHRRRWLPAALAVAIVLALVGLSLSSRTTSGQTQPSATASAAPTTASSAAATAVPAAASGLAGLDDETAVRALLPASIQGSDRLPVRRWARADMPDASGGYVAFFAIIYPIYDGQGGSTEWLLTNYFQWNGSQWLIGLPDYPGRQLTSADDLWLARNISDISAVASPPGQAWKVFTVAYSADGLISSTLARMETEVEIYDLTLTTVWSRVDYLRETDTSNAGYVEQTGEDVDWVFQDIDNDGVYELVATVTDTDLITLTDGPAAGLPAAGLTTTQTTEVYKWIDGVYVLQRQTPGAPPSTGPSATIPSSPSAPTATATPSRPPAAVASSAAPVVVQGTPAPQPTTAPTPAATATPGRGPSG